MPTVKPRLNITLSEEVEKVLKKLARRDGVPRATKAVSLLETALELEEDKVWDEIASRRDKKNNRYISHNKAWE